MELTGKPGYNGYAREVTGKSGKLGMGRCARAARWVLLRVIELDSYS